MQIGDFWEDSDGAVVLGIMTETLKPYKLKDF